MKNKFIIGGVAVVLIACGVVGLQMVRKPTPPSNNTISPDTSTNQEKIPSYTPPEEEQPSQSSEPPENSPAAPETPSDNQPANTPEIPDDTPVIYVPDEQEENLSPVSIEEEDNSNQGLVNALISSGTLPEGVEILSASVEDGVLQLDMNDVYGAAVQSSGTTGENTLIYGLVNTFARAKNVKKVLITVDGAALESGHEIYDYPLEPTD